MGRELQNTKGDILNSMENTKKGTRKSFVLYTSYADQIKLLNESEKAMLLDAIFEYQLTGELSVELCPMVAMAFSFMKRQFDEDDEKRRFEELSLKMAIEKLTPDAKKLITLRYFRDFSQVEVARIMGLSQVKVSREEKKILALLKKELD